jgi:DNA-binding LacI/PurR family transcriptional regulator
MSSPAGTFALPRRHSLAGQSADAMRRAIAEGVWRESLPSERRLCEIFQVSRPTIRTALQALARDGWIEIRQGRRIRLLQAAPSAAASASRLVLLVSHQPIPHTSFSAYHGISAMRANLAEHGFATEVIVCPLRGAAAQQRKLETFVHENRVACCVLLSVSRELQEWCAARAIPALVLGSCHAAVNLPSLDVDYRAVCRHAAGVFRRQGHRRMALLVPDSGLAGDLASEEGFREGGRSNPHLASNEPLILRHAGTAASITARLKTAFELPQPPTALLVAKPVHALAVIAYLMRRGIKVPDSVSLICRDGDPLFDETICHYCFDEEAFAHRLSRLMLQLVDKGSLRPGPNLIFPRYVSCGTVSGPRDR